MGKTLLAPATPIVGAVFSVRPQDLYPYDHDTDGVLPHLEPGVAHAFGNILAFMASRDGWVTFDAEELLAFTVPNGRNSSDYEALTLNELLYVLATCDLLVVIDQNHERFAVTPEFVGLALLGKGVRKIVCANELASLAETSNPLEAEGILRKHGCVMKHHCVTSEPSKPSSDGHR